jgi:general secretion pathway protein G
MNTRRGQRQNGFTLIELVITVAILGLLATLVLPMTELTVKRQKEQELRLALREIRTALDAYKQAVDDGRVDQSLEKSGYPPTLKVLVDGVPDKQSPDANSKIYFLRRIPRDPFFTDASQPDQDTWGLRSYDSSADSPEAGDDVFDVYSLNDGVGMNGIPYRNW